jgi:hypothetical protein
MEARFVLEGLYSNIIFNIGSIVLAISYAFNSWLNSFHKKLASGIAKSHSVKPKSTQTTCVSTANHSSSTGNVDLLHQVYRIRKHLHHLNQATSLSKYGAVSDQALTGSLNADTVLSVIAQDYTTEESTLNQLSTSNNQYNVTRNNLLLNLNVDYFTSTPNNLNQSQEGVSFDLNSKLYPLNENLNAAKQNR